MVEISFKCGAILFTVIWIMIRVLCRVKKKSIDWKHEALLILMYINLFVIIRYTFYPFATVSGKVQPLIFDVNNVFPLRINTKPFVHLSDYSNKRDMWINITGNFAMFIPTGIILPIIYNKRNSFLTVAVTGAFMSLCIEFLQLQFAVRSSDIDDLILNTLGVITGYVIYRLVKKLIKK